jgi:hypothetical protein
MIPMSDLSSEELFRKAAEEEDGMPVSAGARIAHVRTAVESGLAFYVDLSEVPEDKRPAVIAAIKELVKRAGARSPQQNPAHAPDESNAPG